MSIYVVPPIAWGNVLDAFSRLHRGWLADVRDAEHEAAPLRPPTLVSQLSSFFTNFFSSP
jgi:hypothetical protein